MEIERVASEAEVAPAWRDIVGGRKETDNSFAACRNVRRHVRAAADKGQMSARRPLFYGSRHGSVADRIHNANRCEQEHSFGFGRNHAARGRRLRVPTTCRPGIGADA